MTAPNRPRADLRSPAARRAPESGPGSPRRLDPRRPSASPGGGAGLVIWRIRITPIRVVLALAYLVALVVLAVAILLVRDSSQIPLVTVALIVLALTFAATSIGSAIELYRAWRDEDQGRSVGFAILGGVAGMLALGCLAGALVLSLTLAQSA